MPDSLKRFDSDDEQLLTLGYVAKFDRKMNFWSNFAIGFTYLSPVVSVYTVFALGLTAGGPPMIWSYLLATIGQLFVAGVFGEVVSQFPIAGGIYPWSRRLVGKKWAWFTGWVYIWGLLTTLASVCTGAGPFVASLFGFANSSTTITLTAIGLIIASTLLNISGTKFLSRISLIGLGAEVIGALAIGIYLLIFGHLQPVSSLFNIYGLGGSSYLPAFLAASLAGLFGIYGYESCGDVAEEVPDPGRVIPRATRYSLLIDIVMILIIGCGLLLAIPDMAAAISGKDSDPAATVIALHFGPNGAKFVLVVLTLSFLSALISPQAATGRLIFSFSRDKMIFGSGFLGRLSERTHVPVRALTVIALVVVLLISVGFVLPNALTVLVSFATLGIYLSYFMVLAGALYARAKGWGPLGSFSMGRWGLAVNVIGLVYVVAAMVNIAWPRSPDQPWYWNYSVLLALALVSAVGAAYMLVARSENIGTALAGDAWGGRGSKTPAAVP